VRECPPDGDGAVGEQHCRDGRIEARRSEYVAVLGLDLLPCERPAARDDGVAEHRRARADDDRAAGVEQRVGELVIANRVIGLVKHGVVAPRKVGAVRAVAGGGAKHQIKDVGAGDGHLLAEKELGLASTIARVLKRLASVVIVEVVLGALAISSIRSDIKVPYIKNNYIFSTNFYSRPRVQGLAGRQVEREKNSQFFPPKL
jgi:hypothetical protein